jgi:TPR repeat protein
MKRLLCVLCFVAFPALAAEDLAGLAALRAAAEQGQARAQYELGVLYEFGFGDPGHKIEAYVWYSRAAAAGDPQAAARLERLRTELAPAELERAQARLRRPHAS